MPTNTLELHDAKNRFGEVVDAAQRGEPQLISKRGIPAVVVISVEEYERLRHLQSRQMPSFADHLLVMPADDESFQRMVPVLRDLDS